MYPELEKSLLSITWRPHSGCGLQGLHWLVWCLVVTSTCRWSIHSVRIIIRSVTNGNVFRRRWEMALPPSAQEAILMLHGALLQVCNFKEPPGLTSVLLMLWCNVVETFLKGWKSVDCKESPSGTQWKGWRVLCYSLWYRPGLDSPWHE